MSKLFCTLLFASMVIGCGADNGTTFIAPPEGAREMTPEEAAEFNKNVTKDWEPVRQD